MSKQIHLTVATVVEDQNKLLMVREWDNGKLVYNQPAGHVEAGETIQAAALRETYEETGWRVELTSLLGLYTRTNSATGITYYRVCFIAKPLAIDEHAKLDDDIEEALWFDDQQLAGLTDQMRSAITIETINDYRLGISYPLDIMNEFPG